LATNYKKAATKPQEMNLFTRQPGQAVERLKKRENEKKPGALERGETTAGNFRPNAYMKSLHEAAQVKN